MTVLCVNCGEPAEYYVNDPGVNPLDYCALHMPNQWRDRVLAGHFANSQKVDDATRAAHNESFGDAAVVQANVAARFGLERAEEAIEAHDTPAEPPAPRRRPRTS